jgi:exodeoxyribonuclease-3
VGSKKKVSDNFLMHGASRARIYRENLGWSKFYHLAASIDWGRTLDLSTVAGLWLFMTHRASKSYRIPSEVVVRVNSVKISSWNVNGIRAAGKAGFAQWVESDAPDVVCVQETKAFPAQLTEDLLHPMGYHSFWHAAEKPGYSGVATYSKKEPLDVKVGIGVPEIDSEGRVLVTEFQDCVLVNCYFPNSQREHTRLGYKLMFCEKIYQYLQSLRTSGKNVVVCGDFNIAHREIDLRNPKTNVKNAGFLPEERAWMDFFIAQGYVDGFRSFVPDPGHYTWWSYRPGVRERNIGWRIDYFFVNQEFQDRMETVYHQPNIMGSDHCPVSLKLRD